MKNRLILFTILVLIVSFTIPAFAESHEDEELSESDLIRKYCYRGSDGGMYDKIERMEICQYGVSDRGDKLLSGQITIILIILGIIAFIITGFSVSRERRRLDHVKKALKIISNLQKAEIGDTKQLESIKEKLENKTPITEDEIAYLREKMRQLEENKSDR